MPKNVSTCIFMVYPLVKYGDDWTKTFGENCVYRQMDRQTFRQPDSSIPTSFDAEYHIA